MKRRDAIRKTAMIAGSGALTPALLSILQSCKEQERLDWVPEFLSRDQASLISDLVDAVLPPTDTPGGLEVKVDIFIDQVFSRIYSKEEQAKVIQQIEGLDFQCRENYGNGFTKLSENDKAAFLKELERDSPKYNGQVWGTAVGTQEPVGIYRTLKSLMLWGYFSSEEIGKNVLSYDPVPGDYLGCIPLSDVGNTWSL